MITSPAEPAELLRTPTGAHAVAPLDETEGPILHLSLILPTYNESKNIREMISRLTPILDEAFPGDYEIIVVDDNSPDRTWELAQSLANEYPQLRVMRRQGERGLSTAVIRGWQASRGEILAVIDADLQHPPEVTLGLAHEMRRRGHCSGQSAPGRRWCKRLEHPSSDFVTRRTGSGACYSARRGG